MRSQIIPYLIIPLLFVCLHFANLRYPGLHYDELMWIGPTLRVPNSPFIFDTFHEQPLMLMEYIGALKVYFYRFVFLFFLPSYESVRLPMLIIAGLGTAAISHSVQIIMGRKSALWIALMLTASPAVWMQAHIDLGPSTFEFLFRSCSILFIVLFLKTQSKIWALLLSILLCFGLWNKASFIWHVNASAIGLFVAKFWNSKRQNGISGMGYSAITSSLKKNSSLLFAFGNAYILFGLLAFHYLRKAQTLPSENIISLKLQNIFQVLAGNALYNFGWNEVPSALSMPSGLAVLLPAMVSIVFSFLTLKKPPKSEPIENNQISFELAAACYTICMVGQLVLVTDANKPWHAFTLLPIVFVNFLYGVYRITASSLVMITHVNSKFLLTLVGLFLCIVHVYIFVGMRSVQHGTKSWNRILNTTAVDPLYNFLSGHEGTVFFLDWGFHNQAIFFNFKKAAQYFDFTHEAVTGRIKDVVEKSRQDTWFVTHGNDTSAFHQSRENFLSYASSAGIALCKVRTFSDADDTVVAEVWRKCQESRSCMGCVN